MNMAVLKTRELRKWFGKQHDKEREACGGGGSVQENALNY